MRTNRRIFLRSAFAAAMAASCPPFARAAPVAHAAGRAPARRFHLAYAPHFGMFQQHAGPDLVAQLEFMAAEGFTAFEDNGLAERRVDVQERIGATLARLKMRMGVFVAQKIDWKAPTLTSPDQGTRDGFLADIRASVDVANRVDATWMTAAGTDLSLSSDTTTNLPASATGSPAPAWLAINQSANGSKPRSRAIVARVRRFGRYGANASSNAVIVPAAAIFFCNSAVNKLRSSSDLTIAPRRASSSQAAPSGRECR